MKRLIQSLAIGVLALAGVGVAGVPAESQVSYRYLIVLENSARMDRQREAALDTVHHLILSGIQGRIRDGEILGVWTFRDQLERDRFRPVIWSPGRTRDVANDVYRSLRDAGFAREPDLDLAMSDVTEAAQSTDRLTVFLVVSGTQRIHGTLFDAEINQVFEQHAQAMRKNRNPFVIVLLMDEGRTVSHATNPGGRQLYIPPMPEAPTPVQADPEPAVAASDPIPKVEPAEGEATKQEPAEPALAEQPAVEPDVVEPAPKPRVLTVAEIERQLREAEEERFRRQAAAAALEPPPVREEPSAPSTDPAGTKQDPAVPAQIEPAQPPAIPVDSPEQPIAREEPLIEAGIVEDPAEVTQVQVPEVEKPVAVETGPVPVPGMMLPETGAPRWRYLAGGVGLLLLAALLSYYMYQRSRPRRARPSAISRSMDPH